MIIKLLCIDLFEEYLLIDKNYLNTLGIEIHVIVTSNVIEYTGYSTCVKKINFQHILSVASIVNPDRIVCFSEELFEDVAQVCSLLHIQGMKEVTAQLFSNKLLMYKKLSGVINIPNTIQLEENISFSDITSLLKQSNLFIKPISCSGSFETYTIKSQESYEEFLRDKKFSINQYVAQEYIDGELYHVESVVEKGQIIFNSARQYSAPNNSALSSGKLLYSIFMDDADIESKLLQNALIVKEVMGVTHAIMHTEFFIDNVTGNVVFLETNLRSPGIGLNIMYKEILGISFETIMCLIVCQKTIPKLNFSNKAYVCGYFPLIKGHVKKINKPRLNIDFKLTCFVKEGKTYDSGTAISKGAMLICSDINKDKLKNAIGILSNHQLIEIY